MSKNSRETSNFHWYVYQTKNCTFQLTYFSVQTSCGRKVAENITYWEAADVGNMTGECNVEVCKIVKSISQIRLQFNSVCILSISTKKHMIHSSFEKQKTVNEFPERRHRWFGYHWHKLNLPSWKSSHNKFL